MAINHKSGIGKPVFFVNNNMLQKKLQNTVLIKKSLIYESQESKYILMDSRELSKYQLWKKWKRK